MLDDADIYVGVWHDVRTEVNPAVVATVVLGLTERHAATEPKGVENGMACCGSPVKRSRRRPAADGHSRSRYRRHP